MAAFEKYIMVAEHAIENSRIEKEPYNLYEPINYTMSLGGKRLRPALMLMSCESFGCNYDLCIPQAVGLEYYHNFTLLHDDVMDNAPLRRGKPTVHCKWNVNTAILSGDAMLTMASRFMHSGNHGAKLGRIIEAFNRTAIEVYEGQQYDMDYENRTDVTIDEYINMIRLKTSVLFGCACKIGAIVAGARVQAQNLIYEFGVNLGLAFQLQDDYLDVYGDPVTFGKKVGGDILNAKRTFMLISAYNMATTVQRAKLNYFLGLDSTTDAAVKIAGVTKLYNEIGIPALCQAEIARYTDKAVESLKKIGFEKEDEESFLELVETLMKRKK